MATIALGSVIRIELNGQEMTIEIRRGESRPTEGIISTDTPLAKALLNAKEGEQKEFRVGDKLNHVRVLKILS